MARPGVLALASEAVTVESLRQRLRDSQINPVRDTDLCQFCQSQGWQVLPRLPDNFADLPRLEVSFLEGLENAGICQR